MSWRVALLVALVPAILPIGAIAQFDPAVDRSHVEKLNANFSTYGIDVGGTADMDNTLTLTFGWVHIAFQNNMALTIANTGDTPVVNPRVVANDKRCWWSMETLLEEILGRTESDQNKAYLIYDFLRRNRYHDYFVFPGDQLHDPVKFLNEFGGGFCDDSAFVGCSLFYHAGLNETRLGKNPRVRTLKGHMMCEAYIDGDYQFLDIDQQTFYLDLENEKPVSGDAVARDHYLAKREQAYGPKLTNWSIGERAASLFGRDDGAMFRAISGHRIDLTLRPGESITYRWDNVGKFPSDDSSGKKTRSYWGNSLWVFEPRLTEARIWEDALEYSDRHVIYRMTSPYVLCGGRLQADIGSDGGQGPASIAVSLDGIEWSEVWNSARSDNGSCSVIIDEFLGYKQGPPKYDYLVRVQAAPGRIEKLRFETDLMISPLSLPRLQVGHNELSYSDDTSGPREVTVTHQWRESASVAALEPPALPKYPGDGSIVRSTTIPFTWPDAVDADLYHVQVSRHQDMRYAFRPTFDAFVEDPAIHSPFAGLFSPEEKYYWRVKARNTAGVWGKWSPVWSFLWEGPRVPVDLKAEFDQQEITISWNPNSRGPSPASYEVFGSDEKGFTPSKEEYEVQGLGLQPANFLGATMDDCYLVVKDGADRPAMNRSFYRVVAVDEKGVASGPSELLELPHPFVFSIPVTESWVDQPYSYQVRTLASLGDLQMRYVEPEMDFWEKEGYDFELLQGPDWLSLDPATGALTGSPSAEDRGTHEVMIVVHRTYPFEQERGGEKAHYFQKDHERFRAEHLQRFQLEVK